MRTWSQAGIRAPRRLASCSWYRDANGGWHYWTKSPQFAAASSWTQATWATPAVPAGATALSFGMNIEAAGTLTTDDYSLVDSGGGPSSPDGLAHRARPRAPP